MAVKVIQHGKEPEDDTMIGSCHHCKCVVECLRSDTKAYFDQRDSLYYVKCPDCGYTLYVKNK